MKPEICYQDDDYLVVNKPSGMLSIPDRHQPDLPSVTQWMQTQFPSLFVLHRIDKETSGLLLFARNENAHRYTSVQFEKREIEKTYQGIIHGHPDTTEYTLQHYLTEHPTKPGRMMIHPKQGKLSITHYFVTESFGLFSFVNFHILTGRTHQIRLQMSHIGHPLVGDHLYGNGEPVFLSQIKRKFKLSKNAEAENPLFNRLALHAFRLCWMNEEGKKIEVEAPLPKDMSAFQNQCRKWLH